MEPKVFYGIRKTTRLATISEAHEAIEGARNVVNVVLLPPNAGDFGNQESDTEEVLLKVWKKYTNQPESLSLKKILKVTTKLNHFCQFAANEDDKNCLDGKEPLVLQKIFNR